MIGRVWGDWTRLATNIPHTEKYDSLHISNTKQTFSFGEKYMALKTTLSLSFYILPV